LVLKKLRPIVLLGFLCVSSCLSYTEKPYALPDKDFADALSNEDLPYSETSAIAIDGDPVGYLLTFKEVPVGSGEHHSCPPGTHYIKGPDFKNLGFITPKGQVFRYAKDNKPVEICRFTLHKNLAVFFGKPFGKVIIDDI